ncbi:sensor histidine kinase [Flavobacterium sp. T12S277]|uniref:sensor histidine kinase n=1 Tax=Flavobacterium sp. T12S277 TaxID=3402752 RepID=UPI003AECDA41
MAKTKNEDKFLKFNFDVSAFRLLGRELITDRITALFELVKNSYDSNANTATIEFININPLSKESKIIIRDDGFGMDYSDIKNRWMVIGTSSKRRERTTPEPYNRIVSGKKGIGRFAVDKLGAKLILKTKKKGTNKLFCLETDWVNYSKIENSQMSLNFEDSKDFFTDIKNRYWLEDGEIDSQGTSLEISGIEEEWSEKDIDRAYKELSKLISPNNDSKLYPFHINIKSEYEKYKNVFIKPQIIDFASLKFELSFNLENNTQEILQFKNNQLNIINVPIRDCGPLKTTIYYFDRLAKDKYKKHFNVEIDGIKIYRDGLITTPFAEYVDTQNEQKDILGLDKRRWSGFFDRLGTRDLLGYIEITDKSNPFIVESTNRQGFVDNKQFYQLKKFVIEQIQQIENFLKNQRNSSRETTKSGLSGASDNIKDLKSDISKIKNSSSPEVKEVLTNIEKNLTKLQGTVNKSINDFNKSEEEKKQIENLLFSLVSLQTFAAMFSHMAKHTIGHIITSAEYFNNNFPNPKLEDRFLKISKKIYSEMMKLRTGVDFMLKYAKSDSDFEEISIKELIENLFNNIYEDILSKEKIQTEIILDKDLILNYNRKAIEDILDNLISNSIKALKHQTNKKIKCIGIVNKNDFTLIFSDNGSGIEEQDKYRIFDIFFTTTAEEGGAGMGLYMTKTRIEAMGGEIEVIENEFKPTGASFKIILPFKK